MGLLSFIKEAGEKLLGKSDQQAATDPAAANQTAADAIKNYICAQGLDTSNLTVAFDGASRTVTLTGSVADLDTKAKVKVAAGNVQGVAGVNDDDLQPTIRKCNTTTSCPATTCGRSPRSTMATARRTTRSSRRTARCCRARTRSIRARSS